MKYSRQSSILSSRLNFTIYTTTENFVHFAAAAASGAVVVVVSLVVTSIFFHSFSFIHLFVGLFVCLCARSCLM